MKKNFIIICSILSFLCTFYFAQQLHNEKRQEPVNLREEETRSGALEALEFWSRSRAYPDKDIPTAKYFNEYQREKSKLKDQPQRTYSVSTWASIGPVNLQGRALSVAINPQNTNTILVGSASGGLWQSFTAGATSDWHRISLGYPALGISSIVYDPLDSNIIYIGTGEVYRYQNSVGGIAVRTTRGGYGIGLLKTTNGGQTWVKSIDWTYEQQRGIQKIVMNPLNHNILWAATTDGLYVTHNAGMTWELNSAMLMIEDIVIHFTDTSKIIMSVGNFASPGHGVYRTTNSGGTWTQLSSLPDFSGKAMLGIYKSNPEILYVSMGDSSFDGTLQKSTDFGDSWTVIPSTVSWSVQGWYSHFIAVHPTNPNLLYHGAAIGKYSENGGNSFDYANSDYSDDHSFAYDPNNPNILYIANDDGIYRSTNFGKDISSIGLGMTTGQFYNGFSNSWQDPLLSIGQVQDHIPGYKFTGSSSWTRSANDETGWTAINTENDSIMFAVSRNGEHVTRSTNRGTFFLNVATLSGIGNWNTPIVISPSNPSVIYCGKDIVYKSTDNGTSWSGTNGNTVLNGDPALSMAISMTNPDTVFACTAPIMNQANIWRTTDGGMSWQNMTGSLPDRYPMDIAIDPSDSRIVYVVFGGFGTGKVFKSTTCGDTWSDITGTLPDVPTTAIAIDPGYTNNIYLGNDISVYHSTDGGTTWIPQGDGLPEATIISDLVVSRVNRTLRCVTHGNGVYELPLSPQALPIPTLLYPINNDTVTTLTPQFRWNKSQGGLKYHLQVSLSNSFVSTVINDDTITDTVVVEPEFIKNTKYFWRIRAKNAGGWGNFTAPETFTTLNSPENVSLIFPENHSINYNTFTFEWAEISGVTEYHLQVSTSSSFDSLLQNDSTLSATTFPISGLDTGVTYYWHIRAKNGAGFGSYSNTRDFTISEPVTIQVSVSDRWNLVSSPILSTDLRKTSLFPSSITNAYAFNNTYINADTLTIGRGFWLKFDSSETLMITGIQRVYKEIDVVKGWNIIGSNSYPVQVDSIGSIPGGLVTSKFFQYQHPYGYKTTTSIEPGKGYWVNVNQDGKLILSSETWLTAKNFIRIIPTGEMPPPPPGEFDKQNAYPDAFTLDQNYPNPFNPTTVFRYTLPVSSYVTLKIYDVLGNEIATLVDGIQSAGFKSVQWNTKQLSGLSSGMYLYKLKAANFSEVKKMLFMK